MGLGFTFMLEGIRMMAGSWLVAAGLLAGTLFVMSRSKPAAQAEKEDRFVVIATAAFAVLHVGVAVLFGVAAHMAAKRGWLKF